MTVHRKIHSADHAGARDRSAHLSRDGVRRNSGRTAAFSRLERLAIAIGAIERPAHDRPSRVERWSSILFGRERPTRLANDGLEALRRLASVISAARYDLLRAAEWKASRAGYEPAAVRAFVTGLQSRPEGSKSGIPVLAASARWSSSPSIKKARNGGQPHARTS
jgi:hypothetical protein